MRPATAVQREAEPTPAQVGHVMAQDRLEKDLFRDLLPTLFHQPRHRPAMFPEGDCGY